MNLSVVMAEEEDKQRDEEEDENEKDDEILEKSMLPEGRRELQKTFRQQ